jgi:hypothetical protein
LESETDTSYFQPVGGDEVIEEAPEDGDELSKPLESFLGFTFCRPMAEMSTV